jgi:hypothetical protein
VKKPAKCISVEAARVLQDNWAETRKPPIDKALGYEDAREVFYTIEELEEFLNYVKDESKKQGITNPGIRIFFGAYNDDKSNKATVFLAPTNGDDKNSDNNYNINPFNLNTGGWPPKNY